MPYDAALNLCLGIQHNVQANEFTIKGTIITARYSPKGSNFYIQEVLVLTDKKIQNIFIERVTFMIRKYETFNIIKRL